MQKKAIIGLVIGLGIVAGLSPVAYGFMQRMAVTDLQIDYERTELTDIDFSNTQTIGAAQRIIDQAENPSMATLDDYYTLQTSIASPETVAIDMVANTNLEFSVFVKAHNPSFIDAVLDRTQVTVSVNGHQLPGQVAVSNQQVIPAGETKTIEIEGITVSGRDVASVLYNFVADDFVLDTNFALTSFYPTLFGDVSIPANINLKMYTIPEKPTLVSLTRPDSAYIRQVAYEERDETYKLSFKNDNDIPVRGKLQVGVLKGNVLSNIGLCDPACLAPIDNGFATFIRIEGSGLFDIEVREMRNISLEPYGWYTTEIHNPELRDNAKSAFIARWIPDMNSIPYVVTTQIAGVTHTSSGEFQTSTLSSVRYLVYLLSEDFGYTGSQQFVSPKYQQASFFDSSDSYFSQTSTASASTGSLSTSLTLWVYSSSQNSWVTSLNASHGEVLTFSGYLRDINGRGVSNALVYLLESDLLGISWDNLAYGYTDQDGLFTIQWPFDSEQIDWDGDAEVYAFFGGSSSYESSESSLVRLS